MANRRTTSIIRSISGMLVVAVMAGCVGSTRPTSTADPAPPPTVLDYPGRSHPPMVVVDVDKIPNDQPGIPAADAARATDLALSDDAVRAQLGEHRYRVLYVTAPSAPSEFSKELDPQTLPEVIIYDYTIDRWLAVPVDLKNDSVGAYKFRDPRSDGQPQIAEDEIAEAVSIALADPDVSALVNAGYEPVERPVRVGGFSDAKCETARCVLVVLYASSSNQTALVQVDLGVLGVVGIYEE